MEPVHASSRRKSTGSPCLKEFLGSLTQQEKHMKNKEANGPQGRSGGSRVPRLQSVRGHDPLMMSGDYQNQRLAEWLQTLGWHEHIEPSDLQKLNTPKMQPVWRHLQAHVMPISEASKIRKNVLLYKLKQENLYIGQSQNVTLDSINQLNRMKENLKIEEQIEKIKNEIREVDVNLQDEKCSILMKKAEKDWLRNQLSEYEDKTQILDLKLKRMTKDLKKCNLDKESAETLKVCRTPSSDSEQNQQKLTVSRYVKNYQYPLKDTDDDSEYLCEMMSSILEFKPLNIFSGITRNAKEALKSLHGKIDNVKNLEDEISKQMKPFKEKLRDLKVDVVKQNQALLEYHEKQIFDSHELQKEKKELLEVHSENRSCELTIQLLDNLLGRILKEVKEKYIQEKKHLLMQDDDFELLNNMKQSAISLAVEVQEGWKDVEKKIDEFNLVTSTVFNGVLDSGELNELASQIMQVANDFKRETTEDNKIHIDSKEFTDTVLKEIEVFQGIPLVALQRKWNTSNEMLQMSSTKSFLSDPSLLLFLKQTEDKNILIKLIEKYVWSLHMSPQSH